MVRGDLSAAGRWIALITLLVFAGIGLSFAPLLTGRVRQRGRAGLPLASRFSMRSPWSLLTPVFQVPDEPAHTSYVQDLAVKHTAPRLGESSKCPLAPHLIATIIPSSAAAPLNFNPFGRTVWDKQIAEDAEAPLSRRSAAQRAQRRS